jgi:hypothetical protein
MTSMTKINDVLDGHVNLAIDCADRLLLNAYVPKLQVTTRTGQRRSYWSRSVISTDF